MTKYESIYSFNVLDALKNREIIFMLDRSKNTVVSVNDMYVDKFASVVNHDNKDNRYEFYKKVKVNEK